MKNKKEIINDYKEKIKSLKRHNKLYYTDDNPKISDSDYDHLKKETLKLETKFPYLRNIPNLEKDIVGAPPSNKFKKIKHLKPMLSLSNAFEKNDMNDFLKKINNFLKIKKPNIEIFSEP